jgi:MSHA pilin protein MshC
MLELIVAMTVVAVLSASLLPKFTNVDGLRDQAWRDGAISAMRHARSAAMSHRRVVCATFNNSSVSLTIALLRTSTSCAGTLMGPDGTATFARSRNTTATTPITYVVRDTATSSALGQTATVYFQPDGRVSNTFSGAMSVRNWGWTLAPTGASTITLEGTTGYAY